MILDLATRGQLRRLPAQRHGAEDQVLHVRLHAAGATGESRSGESRARTAARRDGSRPAEVCRRIIPVDVRGINFAIAADLPQELPKTQAEFFARAGEKVRSKFPAAPGVYLMQDQAGRVIYVGKAKNLRARAGSYFLAAAAGRSADRQLVREAYDIDFLEAESEVDALLDGSPADQGHPAEVQPRPARRQDLSLPADHDARGFSARRGHARAADERREALRAVRQRRQPARGDAGAAEDLQVSHLPARHRGGRRAVAVVSALPAGVDQPMHGAVQSADLARRSTARTSSGCGCSWKATASSCSPRCGRRWTRRRRSCKFEKAARLRDEIEMLESLGERGELDKHEQPEVFFIDPKKGLAGLQKILKLDEQPRNIEGVDIAHLGGSETVASLVQFLDGLPFKPGYRRFRIRDVEGIDDYASIREVVARRFRKLRDDGDVFPDILLDRRRQGPAPQGAGGVRAAGHQAADW